MDLKAYSSSETGLINLEKGNRFGLMYVIVDDPADNTPVVILINLLGFSGVTNTVTVQDCNETYWDIIGIDLPKYYRILNELLEYGKADLRKYRCFLRHEEV